MEWNCGSLPMVKSLGLDRWKNGGTSVELDTDINQFHETII